MRLYHLTHKDGRERLIRANNYTAEPDRLRLEDNSGITIISDWVSIGEITASAMSSLWFEDVTERLGKAEGAVKGEPQSSHTPDS